MRICLSFSAMLIAFISAHQLSGAESIHEQLYNFVVAFQDMKPATFNLQTTWQTLQHLLEAGAQFKLASIDANTTHKATGVSMLYCTVRVGNFGAAYKLLAQGANPNLHDRLLGNAPLHAAAERGYETLIVHLCNNKANPNSINHEGQTPLHKAVLSRQTKSVATLLTCKANQHIRDKYGKKPIDYAKARGYETIVKLLNN